MTVSSRARASVARAIFLLLRHWKLIFPLSPSVDPSLEEINEDYDRSYGLFYEIMACDDIRNIAYRNAIRDTVTGKRVLDAGTGALAIWGKEAAVSGAEAVVSIEANPRTFDRARIALARSEIRNIALFHRLTSELELSEIGGERCDVLVQELIGNIGSEEGVVHTVLDLKTRLLKEGAALVPASVSTYFALVCEPELTMWDRAVNKCLGGLGSFPKIGFYCIYELPQSGLLTSPLLFEELDFRRNIALEQQRDHTVSLERDGAWSGILLWIRILVDASNVIDSLRSRTHWTLVYIKCVERPLELTTKHHIHIATRVDLNDPTPDYELSIEMQDEADTPIHSSSFRWRGALYPG